MNFMAKTREEYNAYMKVYMRERYARRRAEAIQKAGGVCVDCGSTETLEFDHTARATKSFTIAKRHAGVAEETLQEELEKCVLRCKDCHFLKSMAEIGTVPARGTHGTLSAYRYCKCDLCRAANSAYKKKYREEHPRIS